jgi:CRISPR-associated protein Csc3
VKQLEDLAAFAATTHIHGTSMFKRNSVLKPLDLMLDELERTPEPQDREVVRAAAKEDIFSHLERIAPAGRKPGKNKREQVYRYVDMFFAGVLEEAHGGDLNRLIQRARLLRSAYLTYYRAALPQREAAREDLEPSEGFIDEANGVEQISISSGLK